MHPFQGVMGFHLVVDGLQHSLKVPLTMSFPTDLQRTASFEERKGPERESAHGTRDTQHSQLAQAVVEPSKLVSSGVFLSMGG